MDYSHERNSEHPLARAIVQKAEEKRLELSIVENFQAIPGKGVVGKLKKQEILFGNRNLTQADVGSKKLNRIFSGHFFTTLLVYP